MNETNTNNTEPVKWDTCVDLFTSIMKMAREAGALTEFDKIADYAMCDYYEDAAKKPISSYEFSTRFMVDYGGSEGIYIDSYLVGTLDEIGQFQNRHFCTLKTLERNFETMKIMGSSDKNRYILYFTSPTALQINPIHRCTSGKSNTTKTFTKASTRRL